MSEKTGSCRVPMWMGGFPSGFCGADAYGEQLPREILEWEHGYGPNNRPAYCSGPCCPNHGGPKPNDVRFLADGYDARGYRMWCAVMPDFINLQESPAGFDANAFKARANLQAAIAKEPKP